MMKLIFALFFSLSVLSLPAQQADSPEIMDWVQKISVQIDEKLQDALIIHDWGRLLVNLMESNNDFESVSLVGVNCVEVRIAAEEGRSYCNWINTYDKDNDLNACILRAQEARKIAIKMANAARRCKDEITKLADWNNGIILTPAVVIEEEASLLEQTLTAALDAPNTHIRLLKLEAAYRFFNDADRLTRSLVNCEDAHHDASDGAHSCLLALTSRTPKDMEYAIQEALAAAKKLREHARNCQ